MMTNKKQKQLLMVFISIGAAFFLLISIAGGLLWYRSTPSYAVSQVTAAVKSGNYKQFYAVVPKFSDGKKVTENDFKAFAAAVSSSKALKSALTNTENFSIKSGNLFSGAQIVPQDRYISVTTDTGSGAISFSSGKNVLTVAQSGEKIGPFIPANYKLTYSIKSDEFGEGSQTSRFNLTSGDQDLMISESDFFLSAPKFQQFLLNTLFNYYKSLAGCINNGLNFSGLEYATADNKAALLNGFATVKPKISHYSETFSTFIMNADSLTLSPDDDTTLTFDIYTDDTVTVTPNGKSPATDNRHNATVTMIYDSTTGNWGVDSVDFQTYPQDPSSWPNTQKVRMSAPEHADWDSKTPDKNNSV